MKHDVKILKESSVVNYEKKVKSLVNSGYRPRGFDVAIVGGVVHYIGQFIKIKR